MSNNEKTSSECVEMAANNYTLKQLTVGNQTYHIFVDKNEKCFEDKVSAECEEFILSILQKQIPGPSKDTDTGCHSKSCSVEGIDKVQALLPISQQVSTVCDVSKQEDLSSQLGPKCIASGMLTNVPQCITPSIANLSSLASVVSVSGEAVSMEEPLYVNAKQYHRIMKRREQRAKLEAAGRVPKERPKYMYESRHKHALNRVRAAKGIFIPGSQPPVNTKKKHKLKDKIGAVTAIEKGGTGDKIEHQKVDIFMGNSELLKHIEELNKTGGTYHPTDSNCNEIQIEIIQQTSAS